MAEGLLMAGRPPLCMGRLVQSLVMATLMLCSSLAGCIFEDGGDNDGKDVLAVFSMSPSKNVKVGQDVIFDASASTPSDGSLTYRWNFDAEGSVDVDATGRTATWSFDSAQTYSVRLEVSDGTTTSEQTRELTVYAETAEPPTAAITQYADDEDCEDESIDEERNILVWICARDKSMTDRDVTETTSITLDASSSTAGSNSQYIPTDGYAWDLDLDDDSDNDGDSENDADLRGQSVQWDNVPPGEYEIGLTVTNDVEMTDSETIKVYVSYAGYWDDFEIGGNSSGNPGEISFDTLIHYDKDSGNTIVKAVMELEYPQQDDDCTSVPGTNNCRAELNIFAFNEDDDEADNTTDVSLDSRDEGDCDDAQDCVHLKMSSYMFSDTDSTYGDGEWTMSIRNNKINDLVIDRFVIRLYYK